MVPVPVGSRIEGGGRAESRNDRPYGTGTPKRALAVAVAAQTHAGRGGRNVAHNGGIDRHKNCRFELQVQPAK
jgi:hypothetical protein